MSHIVTDASGSSEILMSVQGLTKSFPGVKAPIVDHVYFDVRRGEIFALLGPSGCGKTTTLRMLAGFETPDRGTVHLDGVNVTGFPPERRGIGIVFQDYALFPHLCAADNVAFALTRLARRDRRERALEWLKFVDLSQQSARMPHELSGGQQQRVALARTLAAEPSLVLLDEPFSNLDAALREATREEIRELLKAAGTSAILVTHDQTEALAMGDRLALMRSGCLEQIGTPEDVYQAPSTPFAAEFLGKTNFVHGFAHGMTADTPLGRVPLNTAAEGSVLLSIRPEHLELRINQEANAAEVVGREFRGHDLSYRLMMDGREIFALTDYRICFRPGDRVKLTPREPAIVVRREGNMPPTAALKIRAAQV